MDQMQIDVLCLQIDAARNLMKEIRQRAFELAKNRDRRLTQIRGAFSGFDAVAKTTAGFLDGLAGIDLEWN